MPESLILEQSKGVYMATDGLDVSTERLYTTGDISRMCQVDQSTVFHWIKKGKIKVFRTPGGHNRISEENLKAFLLQYKIPKKNKIAKSLKQHILLIDDDELIHRVFKKVFDKIDTVKFSSATDGYQGLIKIGYERPDLIILDLRMPGLDGLKVVEGIRAFSDNPNLKIVILSGFITPEIAERLNELGVEKILEKDDSITTIRDEILSLITT